MLEYSEERNPWESMEDKLTLIRYISSILCTDQIQNSIYYSTRNSQRRVIGITLLIAWSEKKIDVSRNSPEIVIRNMTLIVVLKRVKVRADRHLWMYIFGKSKVLYHVDCEHFFFLRRKSVRKNAKLVIVLAWLWAWPASGERLCISHSHAHDCSFVLSSPLRFSPRISSNTEDCLQSIHHAILSVYNYFLFVFRDLMRKVVRKVSEKSDWNFSKRGRLMGK